MANTMVPGGPTDEAKQGGGEELFVTLALNMAGSDLRSCIYALTRALANLGLCLNDLDAARELLNQISADAVNEIELNWSDRDRLVAEAHAHFHRSGGHA